ncbi:MAG: HAD family hydrolase [Candidatus Neomarinimicrobiota bacterium]
MSAITNIFPASFRFEPERDILALDFDGVIVDSIAECLVVGHNAFLNDINGRRINDLSDLQPTIQEESRRLRNFIRHGEDYVYIFQAISESYPIHSQADFDRFLAENVRLSTRFRTRFYAERRRFLREEPQRWLSLNPFYEGMAELLRNFQPVNRLYIITTKKLEYVQAILANAEIVFPEDNLFAADTRRSKSEIIGDLLQQTNILPKNFYFVDDQVDTLLKLQALNIRLFLASWGYTNTQQIRQAKEAGIPALTLAKFYRGFFRQG